ncbi:hypothetical protein [Hymenobacter wooponensis]|uniref:Uncharacterized protein n=1 Tax=Hymenobacter wooponensis TaxID=1525360 RepID=A0A4Z0MTP0_9BACT|nr:hypothetical protein [Hymenobacter wooponensis]TGD82698.1 hypothetical protein EU557_02635 [Hymenobacter wooponensis]
MSIFGSDRKPSGTMGGLLSGLFGGNSARNTSVNSDTVSRGGGFNRKLMGGALLAAGAAYLYNRNKGRNTGTQSFNIPNQ